MVPVPRGVCRLSTDEDAAHATLTAAFGAGGASCAARAPGRCTIVGDHVDYAGGTVLCAAIHLGVTVAVRASADGFYRIVSGGRRVERYDPAPVGDIGDRIFAVATALRDCGIDVPAFEAAVVAALPEGAGLASSAAVVIAAMAALLRLQHARLGANAFAGAALRVERDIVGVACGPLDQHAIVFARDATALLLDCARLTSTTLSWPWPDVVLCVCDTGEQHDVGGAEYRSRRADADHVLGALGMASAQECDGESLGGAGLDIVLRQRATHLCEETKRADAAAAAVRSGDVHRLGALMRASHESLRDLYAVSTAALNAAVAAALEVPGCHGARMTGAGFGGSAIALVDTAAAEACRAAMAHAAEQQLSSTWVLRPAAGAAELLPDVFEGR